MDAFETESSGIDSSPDMNSSPEYLSPERLPMLKPRTLRYDESDEPSPAKLNNNIDDDQHENHDLLDEDAVCIGNFKINNSLKTYRQSNLIRSSKMQVLESPPYRKVRALRFVFDAHTHTALQRSKDAQRKISISDCSIRQPHRKPFWRSPERPTIKRRRPAGT